MQDENCFLFTQFEPPPNKVQAKELADIVFEKINQRKQEIVELKRSLEKSTNQSLDFEKLRDITLSAPELYKNVYDNFSKVCCKLILKLHK